MLICSIGEQIKKSLREYFMVVIQFKVMYTNVMEK